MKRASLTILIIILIASNVLGVAVSDNDGSAFITKSEFDSLKNNFQAQLDKYNTSIDAKIDDSIASYLSGIKVSKEKKILTAFNVVGETKETTEGVQLSSVSFYGKRSSHPKAKNNPRRETVITFSGAIGYSAVETYSMDTQNSICVKGEIKDGYTDNAVLINDEGYVDEYRENVIVKENRNMSVYATQGTLLWAGGIWKSIKIVPIEPTEAQCKAWTNKKALPVIENNSANYQVYGVRKAAASAGSYSWSNLRTLYYQKNTQETMYYASGSPNLTWLETLYTIRNTEDKVKTVSWNWPFGVASDNKIYVKTKVKNSEGEETFKGHYTWESSKTYTTSIPFTIATGICIYGFEYRGISNIGTGNITIQGKAPKLNCSLQLPSSYKYYKMKNIWERSETLTGGLLLIKPVNSDGKIEINLQSDNNNTLLYFKNSKYTSKPADNDKNCLECELYDESTKKWVKQRTPKLTNKNVTYKIRVPYKSSSEVYMAAAAEGSEDTFDVTITQVGEVKLTTE